MRQQYEETNFKSETLRLVRIMNAVIDSYTLQGFKLSVRQLYYQLVAKDIIPNTEQSYKRVASIINDARMAGLMDWDAIEDRNREIEVRGRWESGASIVQASADSFHMDMWTNQVHRVFVIVEKAALAGVLEGVCRKYDVPLLAARGYPSVSIMREMALQHIQPALNDDQIPVVLHLGDHDPSGIDMTRDLRDRLSLFSEVDMYDAQMSVDRIALTMHQIEEVNPPPNPAKQTDARFADYRRKYGSESWELDALEPAYLVKLVDRKISALIEQEPWRERAEEIESVRDRLQDTATRFAEEGV